MKSTTEFVVTNGTDADLWGDIDSKTDDNWGNEVWAYIQNKYNNKKSPNISESLKHPGHEPQSVHGRKKGHAHIGGNSISLSDRMGNVNSPTKETKDNTNKIKDFLGNKNIDAVEYSKKVSLARKELKKESGLSENDIINRQTAWEGDSNGLLSSLIQEGIERNFEVPLSDWQKKKFADDLITSPKGWLESVYKPDALKTEEIDNYINSTYNLTQNQFANLGFNPDDEITLFRGLVTNGELDDSEVGTIVNYKGNAIESWTLDPRVASAYSNSLIQRFPNLGDKTVTFAMNVPIRNIFGTPHSGIGTFFQSEIVVFGSLGGDALLYKKGG